MKIIPSLILSAFCLFSTPMAAEIELHDNVIIWSYAEPKEKLDFIWKFVQVDSVNQIFQILYYYDVYGPGIKSELYKMSACMDRQWYDRYMEFRGDLEVGLLALACARELRWFLDRHDEAFWDAIKQP